MHPMRKVYEDYQQVYDQLGPGFTPEHRFFKRGAIKLVPAVSPTAKHHLEGVCSSSTDERESQLWSGAEVDWDRVCLACTRRRPDLRKPAVAQLLEITEQLLETATKAGGVVDRTNGPIAAVEDLLASPTFPLPAVSKPRDWYDFWEALHGFCAHLMSRTRLGPFSNWDDWQYDLRVRATQAVSRWSEDLETLSGLMYARARFAMLGHPLFRVQGSDKIRIATSTQHRWPRRNVLTVVPDTEARVDAAGSDLLTSVRQILAESSPQQEQDTLARLHNLVDARLAAAWQGGDTLLAWNEEPRPRYAASDLPLHGWFVPAVAVPAGRNPIILGTIAQAHTNGGLEGFSLIWETAQVFDEKVTPDHLRAALASVS